MSRRRFFLAFSILLLVAGGGSDLPLWGQEVHAEKPDGAVESPAHGKEAPQGEGHEPGMFDFDGGILFSQTLNFFLLLYLLNRFLYGPVREVLEARRSEVIRNVEGAEQEKIRSREIREEYERKLAGVEAEAYAIKQKAVSDAQKQAETTILEAKGKAAALAEKCRKEIRIERQMAWAQLRKEVVDLTLLACQKTVETSLDTKLQRELISRTVEKLEKADFQDEQR